MESTSGLRVAAAQLGPVPSGSTREEVLERLIALLRTAAAQDCRLVVFPELALTPFFPRAFGVPEDFPSYIEAEMPNPSVQALFDEAKRLEVAFHLGYAEADYKDGAARYYNSAVLVGSDGMVVGKYRKVHIPGMADIADPDARAGHASARFEGKTANFEKRYFRSGDLGFPVYTVEGVRIGMAICNDRRWPETYRLLSLAGAQMTLIGYNTMARRRLVHEGLSIPEPGHLALFHSNLVMQAGAYQNAMWVVAAARAGEEDGGHLIGGSCVIAPTGEIIAQAYTLHDEVVAAYCDLTLADFYLDSVWNFQRERRIEAYGPIATVSAWEPSSQHDIGHQTTAGIDRSHD